MTQDIAYSHPVAVATLHGESHIRLRPDEAARARIAKALGLHALDAFEADFTVNAQQNGLVAVTGLIEARTWPICVISLEPFPDTVSEHVDVRFAPDAVIERMMKRAEAEEDMDFEPPDPIEDGRIDFGALAVEFLALGLDPYPRRPDAAFAGLSEEVSGRSPFEALKTIVPKGGTKEED